MRRLVPLFSFLLAGSGCWASERADTVLVLPFFNESRTDSLDWIGVSLAQTVRESLSSGGLLVLEREERQEVYRRLSIRPNARLTHASVIKVAEALDASQVIYGDFNFTARAEGGGGSRGRLDLKAYTLDMRRMRKGSEFLESGPLEELAGLQMHLAWQVLRSMAPEATAPAEEFLREQPSVRLDAVENYTRGLLAPAPEQKQRFFAQAVRLDERYSQPMFELGRVYWGQKDYKAAGDWFAKVRPAAPRYLEANFLLGLCRFYTGDYAGAVKALELVAQSVPLNEVFNNLGAAESRLNRPDALEDFRKALEGDAADPDYHFNVGYALWKRGQFDAAADSFRAALDRSPEDSQAMMFLGRCLKRFGPGPGELKNGGERLKLNYEEGAWRQLKAALQSTKNK
jgi:tetratricopeptide (TPR) repeat protein